MMQDEDLGGPARKNVFSKAATRISQVCNVSIPLQVVVYTLIDQDGYSHYFPPCFRSIKVGWTSGHHTLCQDGHLRYS